MPNPVLCPTPNRLSRGPLAAAAVLLGVAASARAQSFQSSGTDFSPGGSGGKVVTNAHNDATNQDTANVRVSAYAFGSIPGDPNFTQDPGFNAPAGSGLPAGSVLAFDVLDSLKYFNGTGGVALGTPAKNEKLMYTFGSGATLLTGTSGPQAGFNIGGINSDGSLHKHLNAFLEDATGSFQPSATPTAGVYVAQLRLSDTALTASDPIFAVYSNGASQSAVDRTKFYVRNNFAPGSNLLGNVTSMIGLSARPGEANLATGGQVTVTGSARAGYRSEIDDLTTNANKGSVVISTVAPTDRTFALLYLSGAAGDITHLVNDLDVPEAYDIAAASVTSTDPLYRDIQRLKTDYPGFSALVEFDSNANNQAFTWDFAADTGVVVDRIAVIPEPGALAAVGVGGLLALRRRRSLA